MTDVSEIRRVLQVYDASSSASGRQAVGMLEGITKLVAKNPAGFDLLQDPADAEAWRSAGGESYCENQQFPSLLVERWLEVLGQPVFSHAGYDKDELETLKAKLTGWMLNLTNASLEVEGQQELLALLDDLIKAAPEADDDDEDEDEEDDE